MSSLSITGRGIITANLIGGPQLIIPGKYMDIISAMGHKETILLVERAIKTLSWKNADHHFDIKVNICSLDFLLN